jgi:hypothetical protein
MNTEITVNIYNWNCLRGQQEMVLDVDSSGKLIVNPLNSSSTSQQWVLIPNLVVGAAVGGFTLMNVAYGQAAEQPGSEIQISLGDDPTPFGSNAYCWTLWPVSIENNEEIWAIQAYNRGNVMDAQGGSCGWNTPVLFCSWSKNGHNYNQQWVIRAI